MFQAEDGIRDKLVTGVQTCALPILGASKIESVLLDKNGKEHFRERENSPNDYIETLVSIEKKIGRASCRERV